MKTLAHWALFIKASFVKNVLLQVPVTFSFYILHLLRSSFDLNPVGGSESGSDSSILRDPLCFVTVEGHHGNEGLLVGRPPEEPDIPITENSLLEMLDGVVMMYNLSVHQQLGKVSTDLSVDGTLHVGSQCLHHWSPRIRKWSRKNSQP